MQLKKYRFKNEFDHIFLMLETIEKGDYKREMIIQNNIEGFLSCKLIYDGENPYLSYDVSGKKSLSKKYENLKMSFADIEELLLSIIYIVKKSREYLLDSKNICCDPDFIYFDIETDKIFLLFDPDTIYEKSMQYRDLAEFLLDKVDHREESAVKIAYQFYRLSKEDFFSLDVFQGLIEKEKVEENIDCKKENYFDFEKEELKAVGQEKNIYDEIKLEQEALEAEQSNSKRQKRFHFSFLNRKRRREEQLEEELRKAEKVTIDEYFGDEIGSETVFFGDDFILKWKEGNFSKEYELSQFPVQLGKLKAKNCIRIEDASISRIHARFEEKNGKIFLQDLNSTNGTIVNGKNLRAGEEIEIQREDEIQFGKIVVNVV